MDQAALGPPQVHHVQDGGPGGGLEAVDIVVDHPRPSFEPPQPLPTDRS